VARGTGIRTERRISHCFVLDVPGHPDALIITDAAVNIAPNLDDKADIIRNAIDLAHAMRFPEVRVAILSALETVSASVPSTVEAGALCKMADRGQITGALLDGPLALDNAINAEAAAIKGIVSPVAGRANVLVAPDLEAGNMLAKSLSFLAGADAAGIVLGARVPIMLTSRADSRRRIQTDRIGEHHERHNPSGPVRAEGAGGRRRERPIHRLRLCQGVPHGRSRYCDDLA
jgi:phosphate acetyltransferase